MYALIIIISMAITIAVFVGMVTKSFPNGDLTLSVLAITLSGVITIAVQVASGAAVL